MGFYKYIQWWGQFKMRKIKFDLLCKKTRCPNFALLKLHLKILCDVYVF